MSSEPTFVMAGPDGAVIAEGVDTAYPALADAQAALAGGDAPIILGALPFDLTQPTALVQPRQVQFCETLPERPRTALPAVRVAQTLPAPEVHRARITEALRRLNDPSTGLQKVVLARGLHMVADGPIDAMTVLGRLTDDSIATGFLADLTSAGEGFVGTALIGASPELLVARRGDVVTCRPFAGSAPRSDDPVTDRQSGAALAESAKNRHEHQLVVDEMITALAPLCVDVEVAATPELTGTSAVWHLSTPITARVRESTTTALDLAIALHPTPAVGGVPRGTGGRPHQRARGRQGLLRGGGRVDHGQRRRPLGGVHPLRPARRRPPQRRRAIGRRHRRGVRPR